LLYWYKRTNTDAAGIRDAPLVEALTAKLLRIPLRAVEARAAANIAWSAAVEESTDPALLCWIWRSIDLLLPLMQADGLSQVAIFPLFFPLAVEESKDPAQLLRQC
jgi:hypothetical protein